MVRIDRYVLALLMGPFGFFALILIGIFWVNRAIGVFDDLIGNGHNLQIFLELVVLFLPQVVLLVLPTVAFAAAVYVSNRMHSDSEIVVLMGAGLSPFRLIRPFVIFGVLVSLLAALLSHILVPISQSEILERQKELTEDLAAQFIVDGTFLHPADGVSFYIREIDAAGQLFDIFLHDQSEQDQINTYTAKRALLLRVDNSAKLIMFEGLIQTLNVKTNVLSKVQFDDFVFDLAPFIDFDVERKRAISDYSTWAALFPTDEMVADTGKTSAQFRHEAHDRIVQPIHAIMFPLIGMAALMLGGFSRFGVIWQISLAVLFITALAVTLGPIRVMVKNDISFWPFLYLPDIVGLFAAIGMIYLASRKRRKSRIRQMRYRRSKP